MLKTKFNYNYNICNKNKQEIKSKRFKRHIR